MATERERRKMSSFFKFSEIGDTIAGQIKEFRQSQYGTFFVLSPVFVKRGRNGTVERYQSAACKLASDMLSQIDADKDKGAAVSITYYDSEPTSKGSPKKLFRVLDLDQADINKLSKAADNTHRDDPYIAPDAKQSATSFDDDKSEIADDDDDDLPF